MTRLLVVDNYDSFTYNLVHGLAAAGCQVDVVRNDAIDRAGVARLAPDGIVLSPGPGTPAQPRDIGVCGPLIEDPLDVPMLGVCLGMQAMAHLTGGNVARAPEVVHGEARTVRLGEHPVLGGAAELQVGRYHSLCVTTPLPPAWRALGSTSDGVLMAMAHRTLPWLGLQFHPESILTPEGPRILANFAATCAEAA